MMMEGSFGAAEGKDGGFEAVAVVAMAMTMKSNDNDLLQWFWSSVRRGFGAFICLPAGTT